MTTSRTRTMASALLLLLLAFAWRLAILLRTDFAIDGDEGTIGLMALHIARLTDFPVFYYGQPYMGSLEAWVAALPVALFGASAVALKLTALAFALATVALGYLLARRVLGAAGGFAAGLYLALPPMMLSEWSLKLRGGYTSLLALGLAILLLAHTIGTRGATRSRAAWLGVLMGLATWLNLLAFPFLGAALISLIARRQLVNRVGMLVVAGCGFLVGAAPLLVSNVLSGGETFRFMLHRPPGGPGFQLSNSFLRHPPQLLGMQAPWSDGSDSPAWVWAIAALFAVSVACLLWRERGGLAELLRLGRRRAPGASSGASSGSELLLLTVPIYYAGAMAFSRFGSDPEPRFAIVLYPAMALAFGAGVAWGWERRTAAVRALTACVFAALLVANLHSLWQHVGTGDGAYTGETFAAYLHGGTPERCMALLDEHGIEGLAGPHWMGYSINFLSGDRIVPAPPRDPSQLARYRAASRHAWAVFRDGEDAHSIGPVFDQLAGAGVVFEERDVDGQRIALLDDTGYPAREWAADSNSSPAMAGKAIDLDPRTGWNAFERPLDAVDPPMLTVDLGGARSIGRLGFLFFPWLGHPKRIGVRTSMDGVRWSPFTVLAPETDAWNVALGPVQARFVQLMAMAGDDMRWQLLEFFVFPS